MHSKLLDGLLKRMNFLIEESLGIFEEEHPWLFNSDLSPAIVKVETREQNEMEKKSIFEAISKELERLEILSKISKSPTVQSILPLDRIASIVV